LVRAPPLRRTPRSTDYEGTAVEVDPPELGRP
jgi:hypothetical protein